VKAACDSYPQRRAASSTGRPVARSSAARESLRRRTYSAIGRPTASWKTRMKCQREKPARRAASSSEARLPSLASR